MVCPKAEKIVAGYSLAEISPEREIADLSPRSDFLSKLVKILTLSKCRSDKVFDNTRCRSDLVVKSELCADSVVTVSLDDCDFHGSKSTDTLRSSSELDAPLGLSSGHVESRDPFERAIPTRVAKSPAVSRNRSKRDRRPPRRKGKSIKTLLSESETILTTIPEIASVFERSSLLPQLTFKSSDRFVGEDALMDTDSSRARAAIALARAQLEHSRPASIHRKRERAANTMMMLPSELEEYEAMIAARARNGQTLAPSQPTSNDTDTMRRAIQQSQSMVLTLMAAGEAVSQRIDARINSQSHSTPVSLVELPKIQPQFQALYKPGDSPLCPPPSIPLPQLPSPMSATAPIAPATPKRDRSRRYAVPPRAYNVLPTEYDAVALQHVDMLVQALQNTRSENTASNKVSRRRSQSSTRSQLDDASDTPNVSQPSDISGPVVRPHVHGAGRSDLQPSHQSQATVRSPFDGAPLTPAPTPPARSPTLSSRSSAAQRDLSIETGSGVCRDLDRGAHLGNAHIQPMRFNARAQGKEYKPAQLTDPSAHTNQKLQRHAPPHRPTRPQSLVSPRASSWLAETETRQPCRGANGNPTRTNKLLNRPPGITLLASARDSSLKSTFVQTPTPQRSPQRAIHPTYNHV